MNHKRTILIIIAAYVVAMVAAYFGINGYINTKDKRLREDIFSSITDMFEGDRVCLVDVYYHGKNVVFEKMDIPQRPSSDKNLVKLMDSVFANPSDIDIDADWRRLYGDLYRLYRISNDEKGAWHGYHEDGWNLVRISNKNYVPISVEEWSDQVGGLQIGIEWLFPYAVGFKRQEYSFLYDYIPSVETAINESLEFFTSNPKSSLLSDDPTVQFYNGKYERGCYQRIMDAIEKAANDYYWIVQDKEGGYWYSGTPLFNDFTNWNERTSPMECMYMQNGYYRVLVGRTQPITWSVYHKPWHPEIEEKKKLLLWWGIGLTLLMLGAVIPLTIIHNKKEKFANEGLQDRLKRLCNPTNFIKQYDKDKVEKANAIFQQLLTNNLGNDTLMKLQAQAVAELGVTLIDKNRLAKLKAKLNPQNYMKPYDAEKVSLANELYSRVNKEGLTYEEFVEIEKEAQKL